MQIKKATQPLLQFDGGDEAEKDMYEHGFK